MFHMERRSRNMLITIIIAIIQSQHTDTSPTSPSINPITPNDRYKADDNISWCVLHIVLHNIQLVCMISEEGLVAVHCRKSNHKTTDK